jgi:hypothetical protein
MNVAVFWTLSFGTIMKGTCCKAVEANSESTITKSTSLNVCHKVEHNLRSVSMSIVVSYAEIHQMLEALTNSWDILLITCDEINEAINSMRTCIIEGADVDDDETRKELMAELNKLFVERFSLVASMIDVAHSMENTKKLLA